MNRRFALAALPLFLLSACSNSPLGPLTELPPESLVVQGVEIQAHVDAEPLRVAWMHAEGVGWFQLVVTFRNTTPDSADLTILGGPCRILPVFYRITGDEARLLEDTRGRACPEPAEMIRLGPGEVQERTGAVSVSDVPPRYRRYLNGRHEIWVGALLPETGEVRAGELALP